MQIDPIERPTAVHLATVLVSLSGVWCLCIGLAMVVFLRPVGGVLVLIGIFYLIVSANLMDGAGWARTATVVLTLLGSATYFIGGIEPWEMAAIVVSSLFLYLLCGTRQANEHFTRSRQAPA